MSEMAVTLATYALYLLGIFVGTGIAIALLTHVVRVVVRTYYEEKRRHLLETMACPPPGADKFLPPSESD